VVRTFEKERRRNSKRVARAVARFAVIRGSSETKADRDSGAPSFGCVRAAASKKRVRGVRAKSRQALRRETLEEISPRKHPVVGALKPRRSQGIFAKGKAQKLRPMWPVPAQRGRPFR
jgi:hypothetical protein